MIFRVIAPFFLALLLALAPASAQQGEQILLKNVMVTDAFALSGQRQDGSAATVMLWGLLPVGGDSGALAARFALEEQIEAAPVNCTTRGDTENGGAVSAQCIGIGEVDLAMAMIDSGYAMADRPAIAGTVFSDLYRNAERAARGLRKGLWAGLLPPPPEETERQDTPFQLTEDTAHVVIGALILGPFAGMVIVAVIMFGGFRRLIALQKYQMAVAHKKDRAMREREKFIVAASLEGELNTNRAKLDAFIIIYEQLLSNLRDPSRDHKYKKGGDIIHEKPALSRNVYDSNIDKLDLLGPSVVADITRLYTLIEPNPDYKTIEPDTPIDEVIDYVATIVREAEQMLPMMDDIAAALNVIVRDKRARAPGAL